MATQVNATTCIICLCYLKYIKVTHDISNAKQDN